MVGMIIEKSCTLGTGKRALMMALRHGSTPKSPTTKSTLPQKPVPALLDLQIDP